MEYYCAYQERCYKEVEEKLYSFSINPSEKDEILTYLIENRDEKEIIDIFQKSETDILVCGHTHIPYHRILNKNNESANHFHLINAGSVGKPKDGNPKSCYAIITIDTKTSKFDKESLCDF